MEAKDNARHLVLRDSLGELREMEERATRSRVEARRRRRTQVEAGKRKALRRRALLANALMVFGVVLAFAVLHQVGSEGVTAVSWGGLLAASALIIQSAMIHPERIR